MTARGVELIRMDQGTVRYKGQPMLSRKTFKSTVLLVGIFTLIASALAANMSLGVEVASAEDPISKKEKNIEKQFQRKALLAKIKLAVAEGKLTQAEGDKKRLQIMRGRGFGYFVKYSLPTFEKKLATAVKAGKLTQAEADVKLLRLSKLKQKWANKKTIGQ